MAQRGVAKRLWYDWLRFVCRLTALVVFRVRCQNRQRVPDVGGGLVLSNHQSHLDPVLIGLACDRRLNFLARQSLFGFAPFRWLIESLDAIPIDREGSGLGGLKETLRRLKRDELVLIFPEGTRTPDGEVQAFKPGFVALARRAGKPLAPVGIDGAFASWPRSRWLPRPAVIHIEFGAPLSPAEVAALDDQALVQEIESRVRECQQAARSSRQRAQRADNESNQS
jgi:1-acyl-sn-glycerol-3-phosphate acyltransferase